MNEPRGEVEWVPAFPGQRPPFEPGNREAEKTATHGAYSEAAIGPLREAIEQHLAATSPAYSQADDHARRVLAGVLARIEVARRWLDENGLIAPNGQVQPILADVTRWENAARKLMRELAMTTLSSAELDLDRISAARGLVSLLEVEEAMSALIGEALKFVPSTRRPALLAALRGVLGVDPEAIELPEGDVVEDAEIDDETAEREDEDEAAGASAAPSPTETVRAASEVAAEPSAPIEPAPTAETEAVEEPEPPAPVDTPNAGRRGPPNYIGPLRDPVRMESDAGDWPKHA